MKENRNLRGSFLVLASAICFAAFGFISESGNAQTKNAKKTPTPAKAKKSPTPSKKESSSKAAKTDSKSKSAKTAKTAEKSKSAKDKTASAKDKKSNKNTAESKSKRATTTAKNSKPAAKQSSSKEKQAGAKKITEKAKPAEKKPVKAAPPTVAKSIISQSDNTKPAKREDSRQVIVKATSAQIRAEPSLSATSVSFAKLGSRYAVLEQTADWYKVRLSDSRAGWISMKVAGDFDSARRETIYEDLIKKYYKEDEKDFATSAEVFEFLTAARDEAKDEKTKADLSFKRYLALRCALRAVPSGKSEENPYKDFLKKTDEEIVYSEPSAEWLVRANLLWELYSTYPKLPISEEIAWQAARNPIPGECEGYTNCYIYLIRVTDGEYLNFYPNGKHAEQALKHITDFLEPIASDAEERKIYTAPSDTSDRADFNQLLTELRGIISKLPYAEKGKAFQQINKIAEGYR